MVVDTAKYLSSKRIDLAIMSSSGKRENNPNYEYKKNQ